MSKALRILIGILSLGLFAGGVFAFLDLTSSERIMLVAIRQASEAAGAGGGPVQIEIDGRDPSASLVSDAAAAGLNLVPLQAQSGQGGVRLIVGAARSDGMFSSVLSIRRLGEGTNPGTEYEYRLGWSFGWSVRSRREL